MKRIIPLILILLVAATAYAQNKSRIVGTVTTVDGAAIVGVEVTISSDALIGTTQETATNDRGYFRFTLLPVGTYSIKFEKDGYKPVEQSGLELGFDATIVVDRSMEVGTFQEVIVISGEAPLVDKTSSGISDKLDNDFLQNIPNTRNVWDMPNLTAGFTNDSAFGAVQDAGQSYSTDGVNVSDPATGTIFAASGLGPEVVEQMDVAMFGSPAEYGAFTGAALNVVTKSGGNDFHGEVNLFYQATSWVSDNTGKYTQYGITAPTATKLTDPNVSIGGPLLKDKVWFFGSYNYKKYETQRELIDQVITQTEDPTIPFVKLSARWDDRNITTFSWINYSQARSHRTYVGSWRANYEGSLWTQQTDSNTYLLNHSFIVNNNLVLEGRFAGFRGGFDLVPKGGTGVDHPLMYDIALGQHLPGSSANREDDYTRNRDDLLVTANYFNDNLYGSHSMKFGVEYERSLGGRYITLEGYQYYYGGQTYLWYDYGSWEGYTVIKRLAGFAQDSWSINDRLTLNIGARLDSSGIYADDPSIASIGSDSAVRYNDLAPRIGFAYDLFGDGKTVVRGFFGRYYEGVVTGNTEALITQQPPTKTYYGQAILGAGAPEWTLWSVSGGTGNFEVDSNQSNQYSQGFMIGLERELTPVLAGSVNFVWKKDHNVIGVINPDATWDTEQVSFSNANGSYSGVYYPNFNSGSVEYYTNPAAGMSGVLEDPYRKYWGITFDLTKRLSDNWSLRANYTYSQSTGNLGQAYGVIQGFDSYNDPNQWINATGRLGLDRPHQIKISGTYIAPFDIFITPVFTWYSGTPWAPEVTIGDTTFLIESVDGSKRYDSQANLDLRLEKAFTLAERYRLGVVFDVFNLFNDDAVTGYTSTDITSSNFMVPNSIVNARFYQVGVRFNF
jgi:hypothetical protein